MSNIAHNKEAVRRYFAALDAGNVALLDELFTMDCIIHRTELPGAPLHGIEAIRNVVRNASERYRTLHSEIHDLIAEGDKVACYLTHTAVFRNRWKSRLGDVDVTGREIRWSPVAIFAFREGKVAQEWVHRDELGMLLSAGVRISAQ